MSLSMAPKIDRSVDSRNPVGMVRAENSRNEIFVIKDSKLDHIQISDSVAKTVNISVSGLRTGQK